VACSARYEFAGEVLGFPAMTPLPVVSSPAGRRPSSNLVHPYWIGWPAVAGTLSWGIIAKEPLSSLDFEPAVQSVFQRIHFLFWKMYFSFNRFKIKFHLITVLPLISNAYKMLILTPIRSVQIALDS